MPSLYPTDRWQQPQLIVPGLGVVRHPRQGNLMVDDAVAEFLIEQGFATLDPASPPVVPAPAVSSPAPAPPPPPPIDPPDKTEDPDDSDKTESVELEEWQTLALDFLNSVEAANTVADSIKGIGPKKSEELFSARPIVDWKVVDRILSNFQMNALKTFILQ